MISTTDTPLDADEKARAFARDLDAYWHAAKRALTSYTTRDDAAYADALEALHLLAATSASQPLRCAAGHALRIAKAQWTAPRPGRPAWAVPGRGVWLDGGPVPGTRGARRLSVPATILEVMTAHAVVQPEADDHARRLIRLDALTPRVAERLDLVPHTRSTRVPAPLDQDIAHDIARVDLTA